MAFLNFRLWYCDMAMKLFQSLKVAFPQLYLVPLNFWIFTYGTTTVFASMRRLTYVRESSQPKVKDFLIAKFTFRLNNV